MGEPSVRHWLRNLRNPPGPQKPRRRQPPTLEQLEARDVPSMAAPGIAYTPATIRTAYGFDQVRFGGLVGDGSGQTVAIVDCYDNPRFVSSNSPGFANSALAPKANIILVEADDSTLPTFMRAVDFARHLPDVTVVSMSYATVATGEPSPADEAYYDSIFTTPAGHKSVTFVAATGDYGSSAPGYPALSPNVLAVGGTNLTTYNAGGYYGE